MDSNCSLGELLTNLLETMKIFTVSEDLLNFTRSQMKFTKTFIIIFVILRNMWIDILQSQQKKPHF